MSDYLVRNAFLETTKKIRKLKKNLEREVERRWVVKIVTILAVITHHTLRITMSI